MAASWIEREGRPWQGGGEGGRCGRREAMWSVLVSRSVAGERSWRGRVQRAPGKRSERGRNAAVLIVRGGRVIHRTVASLRRASLGEQEGGRALLGRLERAMVKFTVCSSPLEALTRDGTKLARCPR
jgi:hypothetical protein